MRNVLACDFVRDKSSRAAHYTAATHRRRVSDAGLRFEYSTFISFLFVREQQKPTCTTNGPPVWYYSVRECFSRLYYTRTVGWPEHNLSRHGDSFKVLATGVDARSLRPEGRLTISADCGVNRPLPYGGRYKPRTEKHKNLNIYRFYNFANFRVTYLCNLGTYTLWSEKKKVRIHLARS